jgi:hypothetical protein
MTPAENNILDIMGLQKDRNRSSQGYKFQTMGEMSAAPTASGSNLTVDAHV